MSRTVEERRQPEDGALAASRERVGEGVSIVIPAYDEADGIAVTLPEITKLMAESGDDLPWEIIVVDDGSSDGTAEALRPFQSASLKVLTHAENLGYGAALKTGIGSARYPWILITDADGTYPCRHIPELLRLRSQADMVVGARPARDSNIPWPRKPAKWLLQRLASYLSRIRIEDLNSGLRVFRREHALRYLRLLPDGFSFTSTITLALLSANHRLLYTPIEYRRREGSSKIRPLRDTLNFLRLIVRTIMFFDPMRIMLPLALVFLFASLAVAIASVAILGRLMDVTTVLLFVTGVQILALGMIADMINRKFP